MLWRPLRRDVGGGALKVHRAVVLEIAGDFAGPRRSPDGREYGIYENVAIPGQSALALGICIKKCAEPVRRSA